MRALVTGGYFDDGGDGVVWLVDFVQERAEVFCRWEPPPALHVPTKGLTGACRQDDTLYAAAFNAVVRVDLPSATVTGLLHQPCMNDLHHVELIDKRLYIANTGLEAVDVFSTDGCFLGSHSLLPSWANHRRLAGQDPPPGTHPFGAGWSGEAPALWRSAPPPDGYHTADRDQIPFHRAKVPDLLHVNHVARVQDRLLATCFGDGTLRDLANFTTAARLPGSIHDGVQDADAFWVTSTDGRLFRLDASTLALEHTLQVFETGHIGWCRGLACQSEHLLVGLTEVRANRVVAERWTPRSPEASETSVLLLDKADGTLLSRVNLTDSARHSKLYSILPLEETP